MKTRLLSEKEQAFFERLFHGFDQEQIEWMLLRNYSEFPEKIGNDLDIFFPASQVRHAMVVFAETLAEESGTVLHRHDREYFHAVWFRLEGPVHQALHVDFYHGAFTWHGLPFLDEKEALREKARFRRYFVPRPAHEALSLAVIAPLWGGFFKERYRGRIKELLADANEYEAFRKCLEQAFGVSFSPDEIPTSPEGQRDFGAGLRQRLRSGFLKNRPFRFAEKTFCHWWHEGMTLPFPPGVRIGIATAGKSDRALALARRLEARFGNLFGKTHLLDRTTEDGKRLLPVWVWMEKAKNHLVIEIGEARLLSAVTKPDLLLILDERDGGGDDESLEETAAGAEHSLLALLTQKLPS